MTATTSNIPEILRIVYLLQAVLPGSACGLI